MAHLYKFAVIVDNGEQKLTITTTASTEQAAKNNVIQAEGCPEIAIKEVKELKQYY